MFSVHEVEYRMNVQTGVQLYNVIRESVNWEWEMLNGKWVMGIGKWEIGGIGKWEMVEQGCSYRMLCCTIEKRCSAKVMKWCSGNVFSA